MTRMHWMALRMYLPALGCLALALASTWLLPDGKSGQYLAGLSTTAGWVPIGLSGLGGVFALLASAQLWRWESGKGRICNCGGLLGYEREGRYGAYRKCFACGRNHASQK